MIKDRDEIGSGNSNTNLKRGMTKTAVMNRLTATTVRNTRYSCFVELSDTASQLEGALLLSLDRDRRSATATTTTTTSTNTSTVTAIMLRRVLQGSRDGTVMRAHQCGPGSIRSLGVTCGLRLLLVLVLAPRVFLRVLRFYSLH